MNRFIILTTLVFGAILCSCNRNELAEGGQYGYLTVGVSDNPDLDVQVKSETADGEIVYKVEVIDENKNVDFTTDDHRTLEGQPVKLLMGKYDVKASNGSEETAFNVPYWAGENSVRIYADKDASVKINCTMKKVKFSVAFPEDDEFKSKFSSYELKVTSGADALTFSSSPAADDHTKGTFADTAYFKVPSDRVLKYTLKMVNVDGAQYIETKEIPNVSAAEHYHFAFTLGEREEIDGALVLNVLLNGEYAESISHNILLNFDKLEMPSYGHNAEFDPEAEGIVYPLGNTITKKMTFYAPRKIKSLVISHLDANLLSEGLPQVLEFVNITPERAQIAADLGIVATNVDTESVSAEIDITEFIKKLPISEDNQSYSMSFTVIDTHNRYARCDFEFTIVSDIQAETVSAFPWSGFSILKGRFFSRTAPEGITFQYKKKADSDWTEISADLMQVDMSTLTYSYLLNGLDVDTEYVFRATSAKDKADGKTAGEIEFRTFASEGTVYNLSFDDWVKVGKAWYATSNSNDVSTGLIWDSANEGTSDILGQSLVPTTPEETIKISGKAVRMESGELLSNFAAGNIYTGDFGSATISPVGAKLKWGTPFTSRPLALRGWYRYEPVAINRASDAYSHLMGQTDFCQIQIFLTNWTQQFEISTGDNRFVDTSENNEDIIAFGAIVDQDNTTDNPGNQNGYVKFLIPLEYRNLNQPTYIVISGAASRYGDYFTGGLGSTLYLDELELVYDPDELTDEEFELVMNNIY